MNVFILSTGRTGSHTFVEACKHLTNYTVGHETRVKAVGTGRVEFPPDHIEADNLLCWFLGRLDETYGDDAFYVHLLRSREATATSRVNRMAVIPGNVMHAYSHGIYREAQKFATPLEFASDYWDTVNANIRLFLKDKTHTMDIHLESAAAEFPAFLDAIGAEGDLAAAVREWEIPYNAGPLVLKHRRGLAYRVARKVRRRVLRLAGRQQPAPH